jgi:hypothetical protein
MQQQQHRRLGRAGLAVKHVEAVHRNRAVLNERRGSHEGKREEVKRGK